MEEQIRFAPEWLALIGAVLGYTIFSGRPEWGLGMYFSLTYWTRTVMFGSVAHTWVILAATVAAVVVALFRNKLSVRDMLPQRHQWIILWMLTWWAWIFLILIMFDSYNKIDFFRTLILYVIVPLPIVLFFGRDLQRVKGFAFAFMITTMIGGWQAISILKISLEYLIQDPTLTKIGVIRLGLGNYHWFAYGFAITLLMTIALYLQAKNPFKATLLLGVAAYCIYFLFMAGSRQSLNGGGIAALILAAWSIRHKGMPTTRVGIIAGLVVFLGLTLYAIAPELILRTNEADYGNTFDVLSDRGGLWLKGWSIFLTSPIWGTGFEFSVYAHNIFLSTLADQGLVGFALLIGFLLFFIRRGRDVWTGPGPRDLAIWRMCFTCIGIFALIHAQASNDSISVWHLYFSTAFLWVLSDKIEDASHEIPTIRQRVREQRRIRRSAPSPQIEGAA